MLSAKHFIDLEYAKKGKIQGNPLPVPEAGMVIELTEVGYTTRGNFKLEQPKGIVSVESQTGHLVVCRQLCRNGSYIVTYAKEDFRKGLLTFSVVGEKDHSRAAAV